MSKILVKITYEPFHYNLSHEYQAEFYTDIVNTGAWLTYSDGSLILVPSENLSEPELLNLYATKGIKSIPLANRASIGKYGNIEFMWFDDFEAGQPAMQVAGRLSMAQIDLQIMTVMLATRGKDKPFPYDNASPIVWKGSPMFDDKDISMLCQNQIQYSTDVDDPNISVTQILEKVQKSRNNHAKKIALYADETYRDAKNIVENASPQVVEHYIQHINDIMSLEYQIRSNPNLPLDYCQLYWAGKRYDMALSFLIAYELFLATKGTTVGNN